MTRGKAGRKGKESGKAPEGLVAEKQVAGSRSAGPLDRGKRARKTSKNDDGATEGRVVKSLTAQ